MAAAYFQQFVYVSTENLDRFQKKTSKEFSILGIKNMYVYLVDFCFTHENLYEIDLQLQNPKYK